MGNIYNELGNVSNVVRSIIICGVTIAIFLMAVAIGYSGREGLAAAYYSVAIASVATDIFAEAVIFGLVGEILIRRKG